MHRRKKTFEEMTVSDMAADITKTMFKTMSKEDIAALAALLPDDEPRKKRRER